MSTIEGTCFIIRSSDSRLVAVGDSLFGPSIPEAELWTIWIGIVYARLILRADKLLIEGDSFTVIDWIQSRANGVATHPLQDIGLLFDGVSSLEIHRVYHAVNSVTD